MSVRLASVLALGALFLPVFPAAAQQNVPAAPAQQPSGPVTPGSGLSAPAPAAAAPVFPKPIPANFTAASPTQEIVNAFLQASWGWDDNRVWEVWAIQKTPVEGISKVIVLVGAKDGKQKPGLAEFYALPDGKHVFAANDIVSFGDHPFAEARAAVQAGADGPYRGSASKDFEIVEFADFQCPQCKDAQENMDKLAVDFPKARIVFEDDPMPQHPASANAAAYGVCVTGQGSSEAFFTFAAAVFGGEEGLATADGATLTLNNAVTKAGLDPAKIAACATTPATLAAVEVGRKLAGNLKIEQTPMLMVNGRLVPANAPYDTIKKIVEFQSKLDGVAAR
jgi:protein-disulfide isomerase